MSDHLKGILITVLAVVILSPDSILIRMADANDGWTLVFWRGFSYAIGVGFILLIMHGSKTPAMCRNIGKGGLWIGLLSGVCTATFVFAIQHTSIANTLVIISTAPVMIAIVAWIMLKEKASLVTIASMVLVFIGIYIVMSGNFGGSNLKGDLFALLTSMLMGVTFTLTRKYKAINMIPTNIVGGVVAAMIASLAAETLYLPAEAMIYILTSGVILSVSFSMIVIAPRYMPAAEVGMIMPLETVLGSLIAWLVLSEVPSSNALIGGAIVILTLLLHSWYSAHFAKNNS
ncbi:MAG TPA: DMT family transporter [Candidatus Thioglobus sp.]|jgi:drug/metabolite transporter (DMT)-like permease|nr:DMT family transporter [Candidatus Thioglobus sp.]HIL21191.1 DMT family transporter [Candidatus Thioglobus sp.]